MWWYTNPIRETIQQKYHILQNICTRHNIDQTLYIPTNTYREIETIVCQKNIQRIEKVQEKIQNLCIHSKKKYTSTLQKFIETQEKNSKKDVCILFSDFLEIDEKIRRKLESMSYKKYVIMGLIPSITHGIHHEPFYYINTKETIWNTIMQYTFTL